MAAFAAGIRNASSWTACVARTNTHLIHSVISDSYILLTSIGKPNALFE
jgi:hypothetical protein